MIAPAGLMGEERRLWPWEAEPYRLWSLLDMAQFDCQGLVTAIRYVQRTKLDATSGRASISDLHHCLGSLKRSCSELPFPVALTESFEQLLPPRGLNLDLPVALALVENLENMILRSLADCGFFAVHPARARFYGRHVEWFNLKSRQRFHEADGDMRDACQCYALDQWTASVFHSMRVVELALRALARYLHVTLKEGLDYADFSAVERAIGSKIAEEQQKQRGQAKSEELEFLSRCNLELGSFGNAWRHHVSHARRRYDEQEARRVLEHVRDFVERLAARLP